MRIILGIASLLLVVAVISILVKKQLSTVNQLPATAAPTQINSAAPANIAEQSKQIQTQVKDQVNEAMKAAADAQQKALDSANTDKPAEKTGSAY